jgi:hypothetical protein
VADTAAIARRLPTGDEGNRDEASDGSSQQPLPESRFLLRLGQRDMHSFGGHGAAALDDVAWNADFA